MAAIFGVIALQPGIDLPALARRLQERLAYRAPDGFSRWQDEACVIGHGALHVDPADASRPAQPLRLRDGRVLVMDGFLANFDDLRRTLAVDPAAALGDAQLLALAIERWGDGFVDHVHGEFAVAVWNPAMQRLQLFCDQLGARPLSYVHARGFFAFASHSLALASLPGVRARLNPVGIAAMWCGDAVYQDPSTSTFEGIEVVPAAHRVDWQPGHGAAARRYWQLEPREPQQRASADDYVDAFRSVFGDVVARCMRGSERTALMLSGGIDSAAILAARRGFRADGIAGDVLCISAVLDPRIEDAGSRAENANILAMTAMHPHVRQFTVPLTGAKDANVSHADLAEAAWSSMHPADASLLVPALACKLARGQGCRLVMNGIDGDNMTSAGMYYIDALVRAGHWRQAWRESRHAAQVNTYLQGHSPMRLLLRALAASSEPAWIHALRMRARCERQLRDLADHPEMAPELIARAGLAERLRHATELKLDTSAAGRCRHLAWWLGFSLGGSEAMAARHGMEARHPWCDLRLLDFFQRLPVDYRVRDGWTKWVVRQACAEALGPEVVWHSGKRHLGQWLSREVLEDAAPYLQDLLEQQREALLDYVRPAVFETCRRQLSNMLTEPPGNCDRLLAIVALAGWLRTTSEL